MDAEGGPPTRLTFLGSEVLHCTGWSPDGAQRVLHLRRRLAVRQGDAGLPHRRRRRRAGRPGPRPRHDARRRAPAARPRSAATRSTRRAGNATAAAPPGQLWVDPRGDGAYARICKAGRRQPGLADVAGRAGLLPLRPRGHRQHLLGRAGRQRPAPPQRRARALRALSGHRRHAHRLRLRRRAGAARPARRRARAACRCARPRARPRRRAASSTRPSCSRAWRPSHDGTALALVSRGRAYTMPLWEEAVTEHGGGDGARRRLLSWLPDDKRVAYVDDGAGLRAHRAARRSTRARPPTYLTEHDYGVLHELVARAGRRAARVRDQPPRAVAARAGRARRASSTRASASASPSWPSRPTARGWPTPTRPSRTPASSAWRSARAAGCVDATTALREDRSPAWDPAGDYLYFISTRDFHPVYDALQFELSFPEASRPYLVTLRETLANPFVAKPARAPQAARRRR